ncbi:hypothetical protein [Mesorhizobium sp. KR2-14]|uniref:hypothetical protein n=1 Tax=Mesorhizobium sp. KR2-14 TaxID=3156610 RepID=UPI0032B53D1E
MQSPYHTTLEDLLSDPVVHKVMARDGVRAEDVRLLMMQAAERMARRQYPRRPFDTNQLLRGEPANL